MQDALRSLSEIMNYNGQSFEQASEDITRQIRTKQGQILEDFYIAYAALLCNLEEFSIDEICLIEQEPHFREGCVTRRYWFEYKPKFDNE